MIYTMLGFAGLAVLVALWYIVTANNFVAKKNRVKQCESGICVALKQRNDMLPNLVSTVKAYMKHENETLIKVTELRTKAANTKNEQEQIKIGNELSALLPKLNIAVEAYPELKADEQFQSLFASIEEMELQLQAIRRTYNAAVTDFNNYVEMFPSSIIAQKKGHKCDNLIEISEAEKANININELFK